MTDKPRQAWRSTSREHIIGAMTRPRTTIIRLLVGASLLAVRTGPLDAQAPSVTIPAVAAGQWTYHAHAELGDQRQDMGDRTVTVSDTIIGGVHASLVVMRMELDGDAATDSVAFRASDLRPLSRSAKMGDANVLITVPPTDSMARGLLTAGHSLVPLNVRLGAHSFLNYYSLRAALSTMPLGAGFVGQVEALELGGAGQFVPLRLAVEGTERVAVPAGDFECWLVHVTGNGIDERYWVSKAERQVVRTREPIGGAGAMMQLDLKTVRSNASR
jgi:hypothetical protein